MGALLAAEHRLLAFEISGRLQTIAEEGQRVAAGDLIAQLDSALEGAQLRRAELLLRDARSELARVSSLRVSKVASPRALEAAETAVGVRLAERDAARERIGQKRLVAQFDGVVIERLLDPDEIAGPETPVAARRCCNVAVSARVYSNLRTDSAGRLAGLSVEARAQQDGRVDEDEEPKGSDPKSTGQKQRRQRIETGHSRRNHAYKRCAI